MLDCMSAIPWKAGLFQVPHCILKRSWYLWLLKCSSGPVLTSAQGGKETLWDCVKYYPHHYYPNPSTTFVGFSFWSAQCIGHLLLYTDYVLPMHSTLTWHFIKIYTLEMPGWTPLCLHNYFSSSYHTLNTFLIDFGPYWHDSIAQLLQIQIANLPFHRIPKVSLLDWDLVTVQAIWMQ